MVIRESEHNVPGGSFVEVNIENGVINYNNYIEDAINFSISDDGSTVIKITNEEKLILIDPLDLSEINEIELPDLRLESDTSTNIKIVYSERILDNKYIWLKFQQGNTYEKCVIYNFIEDTILKEIEYFPTNLYSNRVNCDFSKDGSKFFFTITGRRNIHEPSNIFIYSFPDFELLHKEAEWVYDIKSFKEFPNSNRLLLIKDTIIYSYNQNELIKKTFGAETMSIFDLETLEKYSDFVLPNTIDGNSISTKNVYVIDDQNLLVNSIPSYRYTSFLYNYLDDIVYQPDYMKNWTIEVTNESENNKIKHIYCYNQMGDRRSGNIEFNDINLHIDYFHESAIYPNPTSNIINIDTEKAIHIELFDIFGNKLMDDYNTKLDISHLSPGTYYIKYLGQTKMVVKI